MPTPLVETAPAKVNLTLRVLGRRPDGYHEIESLVAFADFGDRLNLYPGGDLTLRVSGPTAAAAGEGAENLVLKAARALTALRPDLIVGAFHLEKRLPVAAGLGGGSADAAAALRLLAKANGIRADDPQLYEAARATGADVPVCLDPRARIMRGVGEVLSEPVTLPRLDAVLVNPGVALTTKPVFAGWSPSAGPPASVELAMITQMVATERMLHFLATQSNDLESSAIALAPMIADVLRVLRCLPSARLSRMSGSGATCFVLFASAAEARAAAKILQDSYPRWWVRAAALGAGQFQSM